MSEPQMPTGKLRLLATPLTGFISQLRSPLSDGEALSTLQQKKMTMVRFKYQVSYYIYERSKETLSTNCAGKPFYCQRPSE